MAKDSKRKEHFHLEEPDLELYPQHTPGQLITSETLYEYLVPLMEGDAFGQMDHIICSNGRDFRGDLAIVAFKLPCSADSAAQFCATVLAYLDEHGLIEGDLREFARTFTEKAPASNTGPQTL